MLVSTYPGKVSAQTWGIALDSFKSGRFSLFPTNSPSELVISARFQRPAMLSKSIAEEFSAHRNLRKGEVSAQMSVSALRSFHASTLRPKKCASPSANGFGRLQSIPRSKQALTQLCH